MRKTKIPALATLLSVLLTSACSTFPEAEKRIDKAKAELPTKLEEARQPLPKLNPSSVIVENTVYVGARVRKPENGDPLPREFETKLGFTLSNSQPMSLFEIAKAVTKGTGITVSIAQDVDKAGISAPADKDEERQNRPDSTAVMPPQTSVDDLMKSLVSGATATGTGEFIRPTATSKDKMKAQYTGKLSAFLTQVASYYGISWEYENGEIVFFRYHTKTFMIDALPTDNALDAGVDGSTSGGGDGTATGSQNKLTSKIAIKLWTEVENDLKVVLAGEGEVSPGQGLGSITVRAPGHVMRRVDNYIAKLNKRLSKQIALTLEFYSFTADNTANLNLDISGIFQASGADILRFGNLAQAPSGLNATSSLNWSIISPTSKWAGTGAAFTPLEQRGIKVSRNQTSLTTVSGIPVPWQTANDRSFMEKIEVTIDDENGTSTDLTPGEVTTGFDLSVVPKIMSGNKAVMLQYSLAMSELVGRSDGFDLYTVNGVTVQQKNIDRRATVQTIQIPSGSTLVIAGHMQSHGSRNDVDSGLLGLPLMGGSKGSAAKDTMMVITITPVIVDIEEAIREMTGEE